MRELQKQRTVVAIKLREIKAPQPTPRLESRAEAVAEGRGYAAGGTIEETGDWLEVGGIMRSFVAIGRKQMCVCAGLQPMVFHPRRRELVKTEMTC